MSSLWQREPARLVALLAGFVVAVGGALVDIGEGVSVLVAAGQGLVEFGGILGAGELIRSQVTSPATTNNILDAEAVIGAAEGDPYPA